MTTKKYDIEFKKTLVDLFQSGQSVISLSKEFGVASGTLYKWIDLYGKTQGSGVSKDELRQLRRENAKLMEQNEILKKAIVIFTNK
jgi:transposase